MRGEAASLVLAQPVQARKGHAVQVGADFETHSAGRGIGLGIDEADVELPVVLAFGVLLQLCILDRELTDGGDQAADIEPAIAAVDGAQRELPGDDEGCAGLRG